MSMPFPFYSQLDSMDCGATCLRMVAKHYGKPYPAAFFRERCHTSREGVSLLGISDAAESVGLRTMGVKLTFEQLCNDTPLPCIVHWNQQHFAVVYDIRKRRRGDHIICVADPAAGLLKYGKAAFLRSWLSIAEPEKAEPDKAESTEQADSNNSTYDPDKAYKPDSGRSTATNNKGANPESSQANESDKAERKEFSSGADPESSQANDSGKAERKEFSISADRETSQASESDKAERTEFSISADRETSQANDSAKAERTEFRISADQESSQANDSAKGERAEFRISADPESSQTSENDKAERTEFSISADPESSQANDSAKAERKEFSSDADQESSQANDSGKAERTGFSSGADPESSQANDSAKAERKEFSSGADPESSQASKNLQHKIQTNQACADLESSQTNDSAKAERTEFSSGADPESSQASKNLQHKIQTNQEGADLESSQANDTSESTDRNNDVGSSNSAVHANPRDIESHSQILSNTGLLSKGVALILEPTPRFYNEEAPEDSKLHFRYLLQYLRPHKRYLVQVFLGLLTGSVISLIFPFLTQSMVDSGIGNSDLNIVFVILIAQVMLTLGQTANDLIRSWLMLHITTRVSISLISDFLGKLMRLPIAFFDSKMVGDIMQRIGDHSRIQSFLTGSIISIIMAVITFVVYSCVMASYNGSILGVFMLGSVLYVGWILIFLKRRRKLDYMRFQEASANQSNIVQLVTGMQDIKLNNCEKQKRWAWEGIQAKLYRISIKGLTLQQTQQVGGLFIDQTKNVVISYLAASSVISGSMTLGMMMAMQYIIGQLNAPLSQFIGFVQETQDAKISLERLNEIHAKDDEEPEAGDKIHDIPSNRDLVLKNVLFQYDGPHSEKVLNDIDLTIEAGKVTAIVGSSGSGKTTLLKMLLGFYNPVEGEMLLGNIPLNRYSDSRWRANCAAVMQEGFIFSDTIAGNIGVIDEVPDMKQVRRAVDIANIEEFIETLPLRYNTKIGADGHGLSTGQKQRLLIARAAYKDAGYIMFDEATNSLDANNERVIMEKLQRFFRGKTVVIVAHRLSTVKNADKIVVLEKGKIIEQGTHAELVTSQGAYYNLVRNQLELGS